MSQKVLLKIKLGTDLRRITLDEKPCFENLNGLLKTLFAEELKSNSYYIKYLDDENDLITITHDTEVSEAWEFALNSGSARPLLRIVIEKKSPESNFTQKKDKKEKEKVDEDDQESTSNPSFNEVLEEAKEILGALNIDPESVKPFIDFFNPFFMGGFQPQPRPQPQPHCYNSSTTDKPVHAAMCDLCGDRIVGVRFKCTTCPDYDLCEKCEPKIPSVHPNHLFLEISKPYQKSGCGNNRPAVHRAFCDVCYQRIIGTRYKCANCEDYDLCEKCYPNCKTEHDATHTFKIVPATPFWGCGRPGAMNGAMPGAWGHRRFGEWKHRYGGNKTEGGENHSTSNFGQSSSCPRGNWQRRCNFGQTEKYMARYISDVTVEDGAQVLAGSEFVKIWKMKNIGTSTWPENTRLVFVCGDRLSKEEATVIPAVAPNEEVCVSVDMIAPEQPGRYIATYRLVSPDGLRFGHRVWVDINVVQNGEKKVKVEEKEEKKEEVIKVEEKEEKKEEKEIVHEERQVEEVTKVEVKEEKQEQKEEEVSKVIEAAKEPEKVEDKVVKGLVENDSEYASLKVLEDMGFTDHELNRSLLMIHKGNLSSVVSVLLG